MPDGDPSIESRFPANLFLEVKIDNKIQGGQSKALFFFKIRMRWAILWQTMRSWDVITKFFVAINMILGGQI